MLAAMILAAGAASAGDSREDAARKLEMKVSVDFRGGTLSDAIPYLREATGLNFEVEEGAETPLRLTLKDVSAKSALRLILEPASLSATFEQGAVLIRKRRNTGGEATLRIYDVRSAMLKLKDFAGPRIEMRGLGSGILFGAG